MLSIFWDRVSWTICPCWFQTLLLSASQVARIIGVSHWHLGWLIFSQVSVHGCLVMLFWAWGHSQYVMVEHDGGYPHEAEKQKERKGGQCPKIPFRGTHPVTYFLNVLPPPNSATSGWPSLSHMSLWRTFKFHTTALSLEIKISGECM
jgi:hypothetical protein